MNKKILSLIILTLFLIPNLAKADIMMPDKPSEPSKNAIDCIYFSGLENTKNVWLLAGIINSEKFKGYLDKKNLPTYFEPITTNHCYKPHPNPENFTATGWSNLPNDFYIQGIYVIDKKLLPNLIVPTENQKINLEKLTTLIETKYRDLYLDKKSYKHKFDYNQIALIRLDEILSLDDYNNFSEEEKNIIIKKDNPIKLASKNIYFRSIDTKQNSVPVSIGFEKNGQFISQQYSFDQAEKIIEKGQNEEGLKIIGIALNGEITPEIKFDKTARVEYKSGQIVEMDWDEFLDLAKKNQPTYNGGNYNMYDGHFYKNNVCMDCLDKNFQFWIYIKLFFATVIIESIIFFLFGSKKIVNYLYLFILNFFSYFFGLIAYGFLTTNRFSDNHFNYYDRLWLIIEILITIFEYFGLKIFLKQRYPKAEILKFVIVANFVTAILGIIFSEFFRIKMLKLDNPFNIFIDFFTILIALKNN